MNDKNQTTISVAQQEAIQSLLSTKGPVAPTMNDLQDAVRATVRRLEQRIEAIEALEPVDAGVPTSVVELVIRSIAEDRLAQRNHEMAMFTALSQGLLNYGGLMIAELKAERAADRAAQAPPAKSRPSRAGLKAVKP